MKKVRIIILFMTLFLGMFFLIPVKVLGVISETSPGDWYDYITQFDDGYVIATIEFIEEWNDTDEFAVIIINAPGIEFDDYYIHYDVFGDYGFDEHFEPFLKNAITQWLFWRTTDPEFTLADGIEYASEGEIDDFDGMIYWNFEEEYWQIESTVDELEYYKQRVNYLESLVSDLENEIQQLEDENQQLENEIQQLEETLDLEYDRGYNDGYDVGYNEGLLVENNDIIKWFIPLVVIIIVVGIFESIKIFKKE